MWRLQMQRAGGQAGHSCHPQPAEESSPLLLSGQLRSTLCPWKGMWGSYWVTCVSDKHTVKARLCLVCFSKNASNLASSFFKHFHIKYFKQAINAKKWIVDPLVPNFQQRAIRVWSSFVYVPPHFLLGLFWSKSYVIWFTYKYLIICF